MYWYGQMYCFHPRVFPISDTRMALNYLLIMLAPKLAGAQPSSEARPWFCPINNRNSTELCQLLCLLISIFVCQSPFVWQEIRIHHKHGIGTNCFKSACFHAEFIPGSSGLLYLCIFTISIHFATCPKGPKCSHNTDKNTSMKHSSCWFGTVINLPQSQSKDLNVSSSLLDECRVAISFYCLSMQYIP